MANEFTRSITFEIPGPKNSSSVRVMAVEVEGSLEFTVDVLGAKNMTADLRGLFFDFNSPSKLANLSYTGSEVTGFETGGVIDLGHGANMHGKTAPFDVGIEFGTAGIGQNKINSTTFTLSNQLDNLTLDDIANVKFGARLTSTGEKLTVIAPAAPDAINDTFAIFEDGQQGLNAPSTTPAGILFDVLANDTDADGDTLKITAVKGATHGTVEIVDGSDADTLVGDAILYTPFEDYSGTDSFMYSISDNHGGTDFATADVEITAVADKADLSYQVLAGPAVNQLIVRVTASQTDADSSEFIDSISLSGLPDSVQVDTASFNPEDEPDQISKDFLITLPIGQDTAFDLAITAVSKEVSNGDTESTTKVLPVSLDYNANDFDVTFHADDQSIWSTGSEFTFTDDRFIGINTSWNASGGGFIYGASDGHLKAGFQSTLQFEAGSIDAVLPYDILVETNYNETTDVLQISSTASISSGTMFSTEGPEGSYNLDFIFDFLLNASAGLDFGELGTWDIIDLTLGPYNVDQNILSIDSSDLSLQIPLGYGFSLTFAWPELNTTSDPSTTNVLTSEGASNNFLELGLDVDDLVFSLLNLPNPFDIGFDIGVAWGSIELADLDLSAGLNFLQDFTMTIDGLPGVITYEDGTSASFTFGEDILLSNASGYDTDHNGQIDFSLALDPDVDLNNDTDLGLNLGYIFDILKLSGGYDVVVDSGSISLGPVYSASDTMSIPLVGVYNETFDVNFDPQSVTFSA